MNKRHKYTKEQIEYIKNNVAGTSYKTLTEMFNERFGLSFKTNRLKAYLGNKGLRNGLDSCFKKGRTSWNKGKKGLRFSPDTEFKKGRTSLNKRALGSERVTKDGYTEIKTKEPNIWETKHRKIYEKHNGAIPKNHVIVFGDGDKQNFKIDNLILVSKRELLTLNQHKLIKDNKDITATGLTLAKLIIQTQNKTTK